MTKIDCSWIYSNVFDADKPDLKSTSPKIETPPKKQRKASPSSVRKRYKPYVKGKTKKPSDAPRRALSAYNIFFAEQRRLIVEERTKEVLSRNKGSDKSQFNSRTKKAKISLEELAKIISGRWKNISPEVLKHYQKKADQDIERYKKEMDAYNHQASNSTCQLAEKEVKLFSGAYESPKVVSASNQDKLIAEEDMTPIPLTAASAVTSCIPIQYGIKQEQRFSAQEQYHPVNYQQQHYRKYFPSETRTNLPNHLSGHYMQNIENCAKYPDSLVSLCSSTYCEDPNAGYFPMTYCSSYHQRVEYYNMLNSMQHEQFASCSSQKVSYGMVNYPFHADRPSVAFGASQQEDFTARDIHQEEENNRMPMVSLGLDNSPCVDVLDGMRACGTEKLPVVKSTDFPFIVPLTNNVGLSPDSQDRKSLDYFGNTDDENSLASSDISEEDILEQTQGNDTDVRLTAIEKILEASTGLDPWEQPLDHVMFPEPERRTGGWQ